jgi:hypothetical protein
MRGFVAGLLCGSALVGVLFAMAEEDASRVWTLLCAAGLAFIGGLLLRALAVRRWPRPGAGVAPPPGRSAARASLPWPNPRIPLQH